MKRIGTFLICICILMGAALYNGYPLVTSDTGTYINSAFTFEVARDRPFGYSILILLSSLKFSLWLPIIVQCSFLFILINRLLKLILKRDDLEIWIQLTLFAGLTLLTSISWYAGMIMPDIFTAVGGLSFLLFLLDQSKKMQLIYALLLIYSITTHTSHLLIFTILAVIILWYGFQFNRDNIKRFLLLTVICISGWLIVPSLHYLVDQQFTINQSTHVFLTGRFLETGTLQRYLRKECSNQQIQLCQYKDQLPKNAIEFIWNPESPLYKTNGWDDPDREYKKMTRHILTHPQYCLQFLFSSAFSSITQLMQTDIGDGLTPHVEESNPYWKVRQYYSYELPVYLNNLQNTSRLKYTLANHVYRWVVILSLIFLGWLYWGPNMPRLSKDDKLTLLVIFGLVILNAFVTATFGNVLARLQSRVVWLIPMIAMLIALKHFTRKHIPKNDSSP